MIRWLIILELFLAALLAVRWLDDGSIAVFAPAAGVVEGERQPAPVRAPQKAPPDPAQTA